MHEIPFGAWKNDEEIVLKSKIQFNPTIHSNWNIIGPSKMKE